MAIDQKRVSEIYEEMGFADSAFSSFYDEMQEDYEFYVGKQWSDDDYADAAKRQVPALSINMIKKVVDVVAGVQRQNRTDIRTLPIEETDEMTSECLSRLIKIATKTKNFEMNFSDSFKDATIGGLGWLYMDLDFDSDPVYGDITFRKVSPFNIIFDPDTSDMELNDCQYIILRKLMAKAKLKAMFPKYKDEIDAAKRSKSEFFGKFFQDVSDDDRKLEVLEYWYRSYEDKQFLIREGEIIPWEGTEEEFMVLQTEQQVRRVKRKMPIINLCICIGDSVIAYDGPSPQRVNAFPFVPLFGYFTSSYEDWKYKLQGVVRSVKDVQREKNKRRSQIMQAINRIPNSGYFVEKNALSDIGVLRESGGKSGAIIEVNQGRTPPQRIPTPELPIAIVNLEQMFQNDMTTIGPNPDFLGSMSERGAAGITVQLRQKQGLTALQEIYDNMGYAMRLIGRYLVQLTVRWYDRKKIERILGADMPFGKELGMLTQAEEQIKMQIGQEIDKSANMTPSSSEEQADQLIQNEQFRRQAEMQLTDIAQRRKILTEEQELFWQRFEAIKDTMKYDIDVEEGANSPTYRFAALAQLQAMAQSGAQIPPEVYIELADIPKSVKEKLMASIQAQAQAAQQAQQMEMEMRQQKYQVDQMKAMAGMSGKINANGVQGQDAGSGGSPFDAPVA